MNLYLRLIWTFITSLYRKKHDSPLSTATLSFRCLPWDCDINRHLTNSRYASFMDLARIHLFGHIGLLRPMKQNGWLPVISACDIAFYREIKPLQRFQIHSRIICWDEKYIYIEQRFMTGDKLLAVGTVRGLLVAKGHKLTPDATMAELMQDIKSPAMPATLYYWRHKAQRR